MNDRRRAVAVFVIGVALALTSGCRVMLWPDQHHAPSELLGTVLDDEHVLPEGAAWRRDGRSTLCVFGVADSVEQDRIAARAREAWVNRYPEWSNSPLSLQFWEGEPPPPGTEVRSKPPAPMPGRPVEPGAASDPSSRIIRTVELSRVSTSENP